MGITLVQSRAVNNVGGTTSLSLAYTSPVTVWNTLIAAMSLVNNTHTVTAFSDNQFGSWTAAVSSQVRDLAAIYFLPTVVTSSVTPTVTATISASNAAAMTIMEWSGLSPLPDQTGNTNFFGVSSQSVSTSGATTSPVELVIALVSTLSTGVTFTQGTGYTLLASNSFQGSEYATTTSTGVQTATMTTSSNVNFEMVIATFFPVITTAPVMTRRYVHYYT